MAWNISHEEGTPSDYFTDGVNLETERYRSCVYAYNGYTSDGVRLIEGYNYPGGPGFGITKAQYKVKEPDWENRLKWPHVTLRVSLPAGRTDLRAKLSEMLRETVDTFLAAYNLEGEK